MGRPQTLTKANRPPPGAARYRTADEASIVELLLLYGWAFELWAGRRAEAEPQARQGLERLVSLGLACAPRPGGGRAFDPVEVINFMQWASLSGLDDLWASRCVPTGRRLVGESWPGAAATDRPPAGPPPSARFRVTVSREFNLAGRTPGERTRLRLPLPIEDASLGELLVRFLPPEGMEAEVRTGPARLDALVDAPAEGTVTVGVQAEFVAHPWRPTPPSAPLSAADLDLYTRPSEGLIKVTDAVRSLAADLAGDGGDATSLLGRTWAFMLDEMSCGAVRYDQLDAARPLDWALENRWYDCQTGSALIAAVCRARGVPARLAAGYPLCETAPSLHYWAEVWAPDQGWTPFDLTCWDLSSGGRDAAWRDLFFGRLGPRMKSQCLPRLFNGLGSVRLPPAWRALPSASAAGTQVAFHDAPSGRLVYREFVQVERLG